jgi:hypothetical protein
MDTRESSASKADAHVVQEVRQDHPHACTGGYVYLGYTAIDADGEEVELIERLPCRRCVEEAS